MDGDYIMKEIFKDFKYNVLILVAFFTSLCTLGINSVIVKDFVNNPEDQGKTIGTTTVDIKLYEGIIGKLKVQIIAS